jgi:hypothetical protein
MKTNDSTQAARVAVKIHLSSDPTWPMFSVSLPGHQITRWFKTRGAAKRYITLNGFTVDLGKPMVRVAQDKLEALRAVAVAAESFRTVAQYWFNYPLGLPFARWNVDDRTRYETAEKALNKALATLATAERSAQ